MAQFVVNSTSVENIISSIKEGEIAIPEIQRPFVWDGSKVRDLMDSFYSLESVPCKAETPCSGNITTRESDKRNGCWYLPSAIFLYVR